MSGMNENKSYIENMIDVIGIDNTTDNVANVVSGMLPSDEIALQFVLEEIEAASQGSEAAKDFARTSGIEPWEYEGAMNNSHPAIDGDDGPQQSLLMLCMQLQSNPDLMVNFRTMVVDKIMNKYGLGKYA